MSYKNQSDANAYMREWRKTHPLGDEARLKDVSRSIAGVYKRRGKIEPQICEVCGKPAQMHHDDYEKALEVRWFCRPHHLMLHKLIALDKAMSGEPGAHE